MFPGAGDGDHDIYAGMSENKLDTENEDMKYEIAKLRLEVKKIKECFKILEEEYAVSKTKNICLKSAMLKVMVQQATKDCLTEENLKKAT